MGRPPLRHPCGGRGGGRGAGGYPPPHAAAPLPTTSLFDKGSPATLATAVSTATQSQSQSRGGHNPFEVGRSLFGRNTYSVVVDSKDPARSKQVTRGGGLLVARETGGRSPPKRTRSIDLAPRACGQLDERGMNLLLRSTKEGLVGGVKSIASSAARGAAATLVVDDLDERVKDEPAAPQHKGGAGGGGHWRLRRRWGKRWGIASSVGQAVGDAGSAATLVVDDLNRHTIERVKTTIKKSRVLGGGAGSLEARLTYRQEAPTVYARLRAPSVNDGGVADGGATADGGGSRLSHSERIVRVAAEHRAMAPLSFVLDGVIGGASDQAEAYAAVGASAVEGLLRGESTTLIAFGARGSGKSYTLFGPPDLLSNAAASSWQEWGLLPRASHHLFSRASAVGGVEGLLGPGSTVMCSFLEIRADESIHDLLGKGKGGYGGGGYGGGGGGHGLRLRESASHGVHVPDATKRLVEWEEDVMRALVIGLQRRSPDEPLQGGRRRRRVVGRRRRGRRLPRRGGRLRRAAGADRAGSRAATGGGGPAGPPPPPPPLEAPLTPCSR